MPNAPASRAHDTQAGGPEEGGGSAWSSVIALADVFRDPVSFTYCKHVILSRVLQSPWYRDVPDEHPLLPLVTEMTGVQSPEHFDDCFGRLYALADADSVLVHTGNA